MIMRRFGLVVVLLALVAAAWFWFNPGEPDCCIEDTPEPTPKHAVLLTINDIYRLNGVGEPPLGGLPKVRTLRKELELEHPDLLLLHAGDFLSPSLLGRLYKGDQMIDAMNLLDGDATANDERLFVIMGNHEFDDNRCNRKAKLPAQVDASQFTWLNANLDFSECEEMKALANHPKMIPSKIVESGGIKIGIVGLGRSRAMDNKAKYPTMASDTEQLVMAEKLVTEMREAGAQVVVALTHGSRNDEPLFLDDPELLRTIPGIDLIVGGHDHDAMSFKVDDRWVFKADSDARSAWRIDIKWNAAGALDISGTKVMLDDSVKGDPAMLALIDKWVKRHDGEYCPKLGLATGCLDEELGATKTHLEGEELANRARETALGNWVADEIRKATGGAGVVFANSGSLRLNHDIFAGADIKRRHIEELIAYDANMVAYEIEEGNLYKSIAHSIANRGEGAWTHFSGVRVKLEGSLGNETVTEVWMRVGDDWVALDETAATPRRIVSTAFLLCGGDRHPFGIVSGGDDDSCRKDLAANHEVEIDGKKVPLKATLYAALAAAPDGEISPTINGRICEANATKCQWEGE